MQPDRPPDPPQHESFAHHPFRAAEYEAAHLHEIADEGKSSKTPAILVGTVLVFVAFMVALLITVALIVAHFAG